ncbi:hypothetical protein KR200_006750, partial [Drosophila serrata]
KPRMQNTSFSSNRFLQIWRVTLWERAKLEVVDRELIPSITKAKVLFPIANQGDRTPKLLQ